MSPQRTALVTGASSGIGRAAAAALAERGYRVIGTSRDPDGVEPQALLSGVEYLPLDLEDRASIESCAVDAGEVDVLVNNAGESQVGALEEVPEEAIRRLFELNVFGPVRLTQLLVGGMRERGYGRVAMVGSMQGSFPLAFRSCYGSSKSAIRAFAEGCRFELSPFGVWVTTVEPGSINTGISARRTRYLAADSPYAASFDSVLTATNDNEARGISADRVAKTIVRAIESPRPKPLYAVGSKSPVAFALKRALPASLLERLVARQYGLNR